MILRGDGVKCFANYFQFAYLFFSFLHSFPTIIYNIYSLLGQLDLDMLLLKSQNLELTDIPLFFW